MAAIKTATLHVAALLALAGCATAPGNGTGASNVPTVRYVAGPTSTNAGTPPYAQLIPFENSMGIVQTRNSLPPGAQ